MLLSGSLFLVSRFHPTEFGRRTAVGRCKLRYEVLAFSETGRLGNFIDPQIGLYEKVFGFLQTQIVQILLQAYAH